MSAQKTKRAPDMLCRSSLGMRLVQDIPCPILHHVHIVLRLVRAALGDDAIAENKLEFGNPLTILGIRIQVNLAGVVFSPDEKKVSLCDAS